MIHISKSKKQKPFRYSLLFGVLCMNLILTVSCAPNKDKTSTQTDTKTLSSSTAKEDKEPASTADHEGESTLSEFRYPYANDRMVYSVTEEGIVEQWSLDGTMQKTFTLPTDGFDPESSYCDLLWVGNKEIIWAIDDKAQTVFTTPIQKTETGEELLVSESSELFTLTDSSDFIDGSTENIFKDPNLVYVTDDYMIYTDLYRSLYMYDRKKGGKPKKVKDIGAYISNYATSLSAEILDDSIILNEGRKNGTASTDNNDFLSYDLIRKEKHNIDARCFSDAAFLADSAQNLVYYQILSDQSIWQYDHQSGKTEELVSEEQFKDCYKENDLLWDDAYFNDAFFLKENGFYFVKNVDDPLIFSYSLTDHVLSYEEALTEVIQNSRYSDWGNNLWQILRIVEDKLLLYWEDSDDLEYYVCIDIPTATAKSLKPNDAECVYYRMIGLWDEAESEEDEDETETVPEGREEPTETALPGEEKKSETTDRKNKLTTKDQLECISNNSDLWLQVYGVDDSDDLYYAVTDLDQNGKLEIIATLDRQGSGRFSTNCYYQINTDGTSLRRVADATVHSADIANSIETAYYDKKEDTYYYLAQDFASAGMGARYCWYGALALKNGTLTDRTYATAESTYNKKKTAEVWHYTGYKNGKETKIKEKEFDNTSLADKFFTGMKKKKVNITWFTLSKKDKKSKKKLLAKLTKSYEGFRVK